MAEKLDIGDRFPSMTLSLVGGGTVNLPGLSDAKYQMVLFYRGHWWPFCRRQLVGFKSENTALETLGVKVFAASIDPEDKAKEVSDEVTYPVGYGVTYEQAPLLGSWWEDRRKIIQPSEFLLDANGFVLLSSYSAGPLGRVDATDVVRLVKFLEKRK